MSGVEGQRRGKGSEMLDGVQTTKRSGEEKTREEKTREKKKREKKKREEKRREEKRREEALCNLYFVVCICLFSLELTGSAHSRQAAQPTSAAQYHLE